MENREDDNIILIDDEIPEVFHVVSKKAGELGIFFKPEHVNRYCFKQTDINKYLKPFHLVILLRELNIKNGVKNEEKQISK